MPASYTSARFVGREDAFARLATVLQSAAAGASGTLLIDGTAGVGSSRFIDEAIRRVSGLQEPMAVLRGGAFGAGTDAPYQPLVRALRPVLAGLSDDELARVLGTATDELLRLMPELAERVGHAGADGSPDPDRRPRAPPGAPARGRARRGRPARRAAAGPAHHGGPPPGRRGDPGARHVPRPDRPVAAARDRRAPTRPTRSGARTRGRSTSPASTPRRARRPGSRSRRSAATSSPGSSRRSRTPGRRRACSSSSPSAPAGARSSPRSCSPPAASCRPSRSRRRSRTWCSPGSPPARRRPPGPAPARPGRPTARRDGPRRHRRDIRGRARPGGPPRSSHAPRRGDGVLDADLTHGLDEAIEYGFVREDERWPVAPPRARRAGHRGRPPALDADPPSRGGRPGARRSTVRRDAPFQRGARPGRDAPCRDRRGRCRGGGRRAARRARGARAGDRRRQCHRRHLAPRRSTPQRPAGPPADRAQRACRGGRVRRRPGCPGGRLPRCRDRRRRTGAGIGRGSACSTIVSPSSGASPATPKARSPRADGRSSSCRPRRRRPVRRSSPASPRC